MLLAIDIPPRRGADTAEDRTTETDRCASAPAVQSPVRDGLTQQRRYLENVARSIAGNEFDAEDLVQDTCRRALEHEDQFRSETNLRAWLTSILRNAHCDRMRRANFEILSDSIAATPVGRTEDMAWWRRIDDSDLTAAVESMPALYKHAYTLRRSGLTYVDMARVLGVSMNTVATRLHRARLWLRQALTPPHSKT